MKHGCEIDVSALEFAEIHHSGKARLWDRWLCILQMCLYPGDAQRLSRGLLNSGLSLPKGISWRLIWHCLLSPQRNVCLTQPHLILFHSCPLESCLPAWVLLSDWASSTFSHCLTTLDVSQVDVCMHGSIFSCSEHAESCCLGWRSSTFSVESHVAFWLFLRTSELNCIGEILLWIKDSEWAGRNPWWPQLYISGCL